MALALRSLPVGVTRQFYAKITFYRERDTTLSLKN